MGNVELHFHLLGGVDDGPKTIDESVSLARAAVADGTDLVVTTPHVHAELFTDPVTIADRTAVLNDRLRDEGVPLTVLPGGELDHALAGRLDRAELQLIAQGPPGARWVLLEAPFAGLRSDSATPRTDCAHGASRSRSPILSAQPQRRRPTACSPTRSRAAAPFS